jgi:predicted nucleic-acid-binding Zn-ribbon protein
MKPKICPKCDKTMTEHDVVLGLPANLDPRTGQGITTKQAVPVILYHCAPDCGYIELYLKPQGH